MDPDSVYQSFLQCLPSQSPESDQDLSVIVYSSTANSSSYTAVLRAYIKNSRFNTTATPKHSVIITPTTESQVQAAVLCAKKVDVQIKIRSGGHDYKESHISHLNLISPSSICSISDRLTLTSPMSDGLTVDHVTDARIVDVNGRVLDRSSTGEDLLWAIRGGGGSFGVILSYTVKLVPVPEVNTVFRILKTVAQNATELVYKWQAVVPEIDDDLFVRVLTADYGESPENWSGYIYSTFLG